MLCLTLFSLLWSPLGAHVTTLICHRFGSHGSNPLAYKRLLPGIHHLHLGESEYLREERVVGNASLGELTAHLQHLVQMLASSILSPATEQ